jgi:hypothetical protein
MNESEEAWGVFFVTLLDLFQYHYPASIIPMNN